MQYRVEGGTAVFGPDLVLILSDEQASARASRLDAVDGRDGAYRPNKPVQFKSGEQIGVECVPTDLPGKLGAVLVVNGTKETVAARRSKRKPAARRRAQAKKSA